MGSNLEALRAHLERLMELARPDDRLRLKRTIALIRQAEAARAKRQAVDGAACGGMRWTGPPGMMPETRWID
jgi:hypothetical protein